MVSMFSHEMLHYGPQRRGCSHRINHAREGNLKCHVNKNVRLNSVYVWCPKLLNVLVLLPFFLVGFSWSPPSHRKTVISLVYHSVHHLRENLSQSIHFFRKGKVTLITQFCGNIFENRCCLRRKHVRSICSKKPSQ